MGSCFEDLKNPKMLEVESRLKLTHGLMVHAERATSMLWGSCSMFGGASDLELG